MATHFSILAWKTPPTEKPGGLESKASQKVGHDSVTKQHVYTVFCLSIHLLTDTCFVSTIWLLPIMLPGFYGSSVGEKLPEMQETLNRLLDQEDTLEKGQTTHSSILGLPWWLSQGRICLQRRRPRLGRSPGEGHGNPLQDSCLENPHGQRNLVGCSPRGHIESDTTERLSTYSNNAAMNMKVQYLFKLLLSILWGIYSLEVKFLFLHILLQTCYFLFLFV